MISDAAVEACAGSMGAVAALTLTYPLITVNTQQSSGQAVDRAGKPLPLKARLRQIAKESGIAGFYRGLQPALLGTILSQGLYFYLYAELRRLATRDAMPQAGQLKAEMTVVQSLAVASLAGSGNVLVTNPIWLAVARMQAAGKAHRSTTFVDELRGLVREGGILALWRGIVPTLVMVANPTVQYALYEWGTNLWRHRQPAAARSRTLSNVTVFIISALAKLGATLATYPLQVVKNRIQTARGGHDRERFSGIVSTIGSILRREGLLGFFSGIRTKILQSVLAAATMFLLKERLHELTLASIRGLQAR